MMAPAAAVRSGHVIAGFRRVMRYNTDADLTASGDYASRRETCRTGKRDRDPICAIGRVG